MGMDKEQLFFLDALSFKLFCLFLKEEEGEWEYWISKD